MRNRIFRGYNMDHPTIGSDFKAQRKIEGDMNQYLNIKHKPSVLGTTPLTQGFTNPVPIDIKDDFRTNPDLSKQHTVPTGIWRNEKRTMYSSKYHPPMMNDNAIMKKTNVFDSDYLM